MKKILIIAGMILISASLILLFGGCARSLTENLVEKAIENAAQKEGENVDVNLDEGEINITDEEGNEFSIGSANIPEGWPASVPVNENIKIALSSSSESDDKTTWNIAGDFNGNAED